MRETLAILNKEFASSLGVTVTVRTGLNTGEVLAREPGGGQAIVVVTHDPRVAATADRIVSLVDGLVVDDTRLGAARPVEPLVDLGRPS